MSDPDDKTPAHTPNAKRSSAQHAFDLQDCPCCLLRGFSMTCECCGGGRKVTRETAEGWKFAHSPESEPPT